MIDIKFDGYDMTVTGHAKEDVCVAVSTLAGTLGIALETIAPRSDNKVCLDKGAGRISCVPVDTEEAAVDTIFRTIRAGVRELAESYPEEVRCEE